MDKNLLTHIEIMEYLGVRRDKITPAFIDAYKKWWKDVRDRFDKGVGKETLERENSTIIEFVPKDIEEKMRMKQLEIVIKQKHADFLKEYRWYIVDLETFWGAYICHPLGWGLVFHDTRSENKYTKLIRSYYENVFERIASYASTIN